MLKGSPVERRSIISGKVCQVIFPESSAFDSIDFSVPPTVSVESASRIYYTPLRRTGGDVTGVPRSAVYLFVFLSFGRIMGCLLFIVGSGWAGCFDSWAAMYDWVAGVFDLLLFCSLFRWSGSQVKFFVCSFSRERLTV